jgi:double-stranded uracil-DNA glycosylase
MPQHKLPDQLGPDLNVVFVGTAAGKDSAAKGFYYAKPGNRFWSALHEAGLTARRYEPEEFKELRKLGIGFTDVCKTEAGNDNQIKDFDVAGFNRKMRKHQPRAIAFTSKKAAALWQGAKSTAEIDCGRQKRRSDDYPEVFVLTSPSGQAASYWDIGPWRELATWLRANAR